MTVAAAIFDPDGNQISSAVIQPDEPAFLSFFSKGVNGLALDREAYVVFERPSAARLYSLSAVKTDDAANVIWRVELTAHPREEGCLPSPVSDDRSLILSCGHSARRLVFIDRETGDHRTFAIPRPACETYPYSRLLVTSAGPDAVLLLSLSEMPPMGRQPNCVWLARVEIN